MKRSIAYPIILVLMIATLMSGIGWYRAHQEALALQNIALDTMSRELDLLKENTKRERMKIKDLQWAQRMRELWETEACGSAECHPSCIKVYEGIITKY